MSRHLSYSQINTYLQCPYLWGLQTFKGLKRKGAEPELLLGTALHEALSLYARWYVESRTHDYDVLIGYYSTVLKDENIISVPLPFATASKGTKYLETLFNAQFDLGGVEMVEKRLEVEFGEGVNIVAILDRVDKIEDGHYRIVDYKTGGFYTKNAVKESLQLRMYAAAFWIEMDGDIDVLTAAIQIISTGELIEVFLDQNDIDETVDYVNQIAQRMYSDTKLQANPGKACIRYGGCWGAHACKEHQQTQLMTQGAQIDLASASNTELARWYTHLTYMQHAVQGAIKERLKTGADELVYGNNRALLKPSFKKIIDEAVLDKLFANYATYGLTPLSIMNLDSRRIDSAINRVANNIAADQSLSDAEAQELTKYLTDLRRNLYVEVLSGSRFAFSMDKQ